jgi:hypothetical protein
LELLGLAATAAVAGLLLDFAATVVLEEALEY